MHVAIFDNDPQQREQIVSALTAADHRWLAFDQFEALLEGLRDRDIDLLVYHWQPESEGLRRLQQLRQGRPALPVLLVTGRAPERQLTEALSDGLCDYLVKPLRRSELAVRARLLMARADPSQLSVPTLDFGPFAFDVRGARLSKDGEPIALTQKEFDLALLLFRNLGRPLSRATILEAVWPQDAALSSRTMDTHVSRVRNKLGLRPENGFRLTPVYSYGYRLEQLGTVDQNPDGRQV